MLNKNSNSVNPIHVKITCPRCGSTEIAFVTEYHKCLILRLLFYIGLIFSVGLGLQYFTLTFVLSNKDSYEVFFAFLIVAMIFTIICRAFTIIKESRTHVKAICRNCGNLWLID